MTVQEIQHALAINTTIRNEKMPMLLDLKVERMCGPIVEVVNGCVQFVHFTVKE